MKPATLRMRRWRKKNPEKQKEIDRRFRERHPDRCKARQKKWYKENKQRELKRNKLYHSKNKDKIRVRHRLNRHHMTAKQYETMLKKQKNRCGVCRKKFQKTPHIDHCHKTMRNRGLLCDDCNLGLGRFKDSVRVLNLAIKYLKDCDADTIK